jgi:hypothetical protein
MGTASLAPPRRHRKLVPEEKRGPRSVLPPCARGASCRCCPDEDEREVWEDVGAGLGALESAEGVRAAAEERHAESHQGECASV